MKMSANENESLDIRLYANRRSDLIDLEELNRMERPSRVFSSRHHLSIPPVLTDTNNMDQNEHQLRSRDYTSYFESLNSSYARNGGSTVAGDILRTRSPFVRFTITDPETQQITAAGQIPLNSPPTSSQTNTLTTNAEVADVSLTEESDDEPFDFRREYFEQRRLTDHLNAVLQEQQLRNNRSGRRTRRFTEYPYLIRSNLDNNSSNDRLPFRRSVRFASTTRGFNDHPPDRSQTPEQELPEVLEQEMEPENQEYEEVYHAQESMSSLSSHNDADSDVGGDDRSTNFSVSETPNSNADEENRDTLDLSNETPRTRVVPFIMSPIPLSPRTDSPPDLLEIPATSINNSVSTALPFVNNDSDNLGTSFRHPNPLIPPLSPMDRYFVRSETRHSNGVITTVVDVGLGTAVNANAVGSPAVSNEVIDLDNVDNNQTTNLGNPQIVHCASAISQGRLTEETTPVRVEEHPETYEDLNDQLIRLFECPVCFEHIVPPIFQCLLGHLICNKCVLMCENCPTCRNPFNSKRNLYMEKVCYLVKFPCRNALTGCKQQMFIAQKEVHEQECCYRHYQCFFTNCAWKGYYPELHLHMMNNHHTYILAGSDQSIDILLPNNNQTYKWFLLAHGEYFAIIAHASVPPRRVKVQVNFIGPAVKAKQFKFTIILTQQKDHGDRSQKLMYERSTLPYSEIYEMSNNNGLKKDIFSLPGEVLEPFIKKKRRRLPIMLRIDPVSTNT